MDGLRIRRNMVQTKVSNRSQCWPFQDVERGGMNPSQQEQSRIPDRKNKIKTNKAMSIVMARRSRNARTTVATSVGITTKL
jgi:hypothetical protein